MNKGNYLQKSKQKKADTGQKTSSKLSITLDDIKKVKLRKPEERSNSLNSGSKAQVETSGSGPLVTLQQLRKVTLRSSSSNLLRQKNPGEEDKENSVDQEKLAKQASAKRQHLKKTQMKRSPGGTPITGKKRKRESGQGLTNIMSKALRRKFELTRTPSVEEKTSGGSHSPASPQFPNNSPQMGNSSPQETGKSPLSSSNTDVETTTAKDLTETILPPENEVVEDNNNGNEHRSKVNKLEDSTVCRRMSNNAGHEDTEELQPDLPAQEDCTAKVDKCLENSNNNSKDTADGGEGDSGIVE
ncbi:uncharacterized protein LOC135476818 [Liolophura sinensis]|uniref:uncharacterized protein LOC135476818 n=1 Tax=Liolophura sinensis TaxID=3198878 RepID=UPI003158C5EE